MRTTRDALLGGRVIYEQPAEGYRVALEAPMLARFATGGRSRPFRSVVDLASGPGAVALCLCATGWAEHAVAVEIDRDHAELARRNAIANDAAIDVVEGDVAAVTAPRGELVIANPPWFEADAGPLATGTARAGARAFTRGSLRSFMVAARRLLAPRGRVVVAMPVARFVETLTELGGVGLHIKRARFVYPRAGEEADVVFLEAKPARIGGLVVERPWYVRGKGEDYTTEAYETLFTATWGTAAAAARSSAPASGRDPA
jgi:tRNA1(Val) A37 N6-methylase TrmN6